MRSCQTLIHAGWIITQNSRREVLENSSLAIANGRVLALGPTAEMKSGWRAEEDLDLREMLVLPGLVNSHTHAAMTFLRGFADDLPLMDWLEKCVFPVEAGLTGEIVRLGSLLGHAEMLASGTTACVDMYIYEDEVFNAAEISGIRCLGGEAVFNFPSAACPDWRAALRRTEELAEKYAGHPRIKLAVNPHSVYTTTREILQACRRLALDRDLPVHIHLAENRAETDLCQQKHGCRPLAWLRQNGLLDCRLIAAHLVDVTEDEALALAAAGAAGAHNPSSNMKLASGIAPAETLLAAGLPLGLGTDGPASNNTLNMFAEMARAALLAKIGAMDSRALPAAKVLDMATLGGGAVFGDPALGSLEPGKAADLTALDAGLPHLQPMHNPVSQLVYAASGHECRLTMAGGEILYRDGKFTRFDYESLKKEIKKLRDFVRKRV